MNFRNINENECIYLPTVWSNTANLPAEYLTPHTLNLNLKNKMKHNSKTMKYPPSETEFDLNQQVDCHFQMQHFKIT